MTSAFKPKHQRLVLLVLALVALIGAGLLAAWALRNQASYFYVPSDIQANPPSPGQAVRLGGMVEEGSIRTEADGVTVRFIVGDGEARVPVVFSGIVPDLFVEGSGVVADGSMRSDGVFVADELLAKHDENYMPRELEDMTAAQARATVAETSE
ncbi:cytochrome c-type biogenesis protein CcmE [Altererythrobacter atlanticus]|uniref:Cytochrome c-type biogenesis protein CcmE n=1 Tax=Croceibacterium atlanticum TaxID=1267766 RepID=A0A0F7KQP3_9SPHN|nr:cytochrome c maturation protein CcmE [Croceibacterium atlanticum]AKH41874.1 Cytochrome c-type biogenesis protein CcmE [Croceibacterium atlanticum]MBB5733563.1 cytochrome c-type biogenesis protein CcmE [Croceibacterium atlanticum]